MLDRVLLPGAVEIDTERRSAVRYGLLLGGLESSVPPVAVRQADAGHAAADGGCMLIMQHCRRRRRVALRVVLYSGREPLIKCCW